jgi:hypothetical protein
MESKEILAASGGVYRQDERSRMESRLKPRIAKDEMTFALDMYCHG